MEDCVRQTMFLLADFLHECIITLVLPHRSIAHSKMGILREYAKSLWCPQSTWVALHIKIFSTAQKWSNMQKLSANLDVVLIFAQGHYGGLCYTNHVIVCHKYMLFCFKSTVTPFHRWRIWITTIATIISPAPLKKNSLAEYFCLSPRRNELLWSKKRNLFFLRGNFRTISAPPTHSLIVRSHQ